tara:strand:+ start:279 stop:1655 length:1377 start_codon:yes stop_codon:yes gene_type:complete
MITSVTGSTALLMTGIVEKGNLISPGLGLQYLLAAGLLTGVLQIAWGYLRLAYQMRFVPQSVMNGFVNGLAILIFMAQLEFFLPSISHAKESITQLDQLPEVWFLLIITLLIIYFLPKITTIIPSALVAILVCTSISNGLDLNFIGLDLKDVPTVSDLPGSLPEALPSFGLPQVDFNLETLGLILPTALAISLVGLMETFLTQDILDDATDKSTNKNVEARGQGIGNILSSLFGGMAGCALVGQSVMNVGYGGRTRLSTLSSGLCLISMILLAKDWVNQIPMATLVGVMIMIAINTANWSSIRDIRRIPKSDSSVMILTVLVTVITHNLAIGLLSGVGLAAILFSRKVAKVIKVESSLTSENQRIYKVKGQLFFVSSIYFRQGFELHEHPEKVTIDMAEAHIWDQSGVNVLDQVIRKIKLGGSQVEVINLNDESLNLFSRIGQATEAGGRGGEFKSAH